MFSARKSGAPAGGYPINNSLRFQSASSQYLSRTFGTPTNNKIWTWSAWVKRGKLSVANINLLGCYDGTSANSAYLAFNSNDTLTFQYGGAASNSGTTTAVYRDIAAWYHIVWSVNATTGSSTLYINGNSVATASIANVASQINSAIAHNIGQLYSSLWFFDGYMTEVNFIDGQALTPSSFGETNTLTGQWIAKRYTGTYGTNGFYLPFSNGTSTTTLGADSSGNGNNWTLTNFTRSAGVSDCWMYDVPSGNGSSVSGTQPNSNYAVLNPLMKSPTMQVTYSNLRSLTSPNIACSVGASFGLTSGKFYWEAQVFTGPVGSQPLYGIALPTYAGFRTDGSFLGFTSDSWGLGANDGTFKNNSTTLGTYSSLANNDIVMMAIDMDNNKFWMGKNGTWFNSGVPANGTGAILTSGLTGNTIFPAVTEYGGTSSNFNFGQRSFAYTPPSGFKALCTANLPASTIVKGNQYMDAVTYAGNGVASSGTTQTISLSFDPDLAWVKNRTSASTNHNLSNIQAVGKSLASNLTNAEITNSSITLGTGGFSVAENGGAGNLGYNLNLSGQNYVGWAWDAGSSTVTNTNGTISSQVRANPTSGVSVVTYTGNGTLGATVGHGLGIAPAMVIFKNRGSGTAGWATYHKNLTSASYALLLNSTAAQDNRGTQFLNNTAPSSSVVTLGNWTEVNASTNTYVAFCFAEIAGFSKFGSYTGNGSADGPFQYLGFRPRFIMWKRTSSTSDWIIWDTARNTYNAVNTALFPDTSDAESTNTAYDIDVLSNGFKMRTSNATLNGSGSTYIFAAFAENPFAQANAR